MSFDFTTIDDELTPILFILGGLVLGISGCGVSVTGGLCPDRLPTGLHHQQVRSVLLKTETTIQGEAGNPWKGSD